MQIKKLRNHNLPDLVELHKKIFDNYYLTKLGDTVLTNYYNHFLNDPENTLLGLYENNQSHLIGFALFVKDYDKKMDRFFRKHFLLLTYNIIKKIVSLDSVILNGTFSRIRKIFFKNQNKTLEINYPMLTLLSVGIKKEYRGNGYIKLLINEGLKFNNDEDRVYLSVLNNNKSALRAYEKLDFYKIGLIEDLVILEKKNEYYKK